MSKKKVKTRKKPISKIIFVFAALLSIWAPILVFQRLFLDDMEYFNPYNNELVLPLIFCLLYILLCIWLVPKMKNIVFQSLFFLLAPLLVISYVFFDIADTNKIEFGNSWRASEVFIELVCSKSYFLPLLIIGVLLNYISNLWYFKSKNRLMS